LWWYKIGFYYRKNGTGVIRVISRQYEIYRVRTSTKTDRTTAFNNGSASISLTSLTLQILRCQLSNCLECVLSHIRSGNMAELTVALRMSWDNLPDKMRHKSVESFYKWRASRVKSSKLTCTCIFDLWSKCHWYLYTTVAATFVSDGQTVIWVQNAPKKNGRKRERDFLRLAIRHALSCYVMLFTDFVNYWTFVHHAQWSRLSW